MTLRCNSIRWQLSYASTRRAILQVVERLTSTSAVSIPGIVFQAAVLSREIHTSYNGSYTCSLAHSPKAPVSSGAVRHSSPSKQRLHAVDESFQSNHKLYELYSLPIQTQFPAFGQERSCCQRTDSDELDVGQRRKCSRHRNTAATAASHGYRNR